MYNIVAGEAGRILSLCLRSSPHRPQTRWPVLLADVSYDGIEQLATDLPTCAGDRIDHLPDFVAAIGSYLLAKVS